MILPLGNAYKYDQLNRLLEARSYNNLDMNTNSFTAGGTEMYFNQFTYDANGNIETQVRKDHLNSPIDHLVYHYSDGANGRIQNRLYHVNDISGILPTDQDGDIEDMVNVHPSNTTQSTAFIDNPTDPDGINLYNNYSYTEIGELERDNQEGIEEIIWRVDSKVKEVHRSAGSSRKNLKFDYDAMGGAQLRILVG